MSQTQQPKSVNAPSKRLRCVHPRKFRGVTIDCWCGPAELFVGDLTVTHLEDLGQLTTPNQHVIIPFSECEKIGELKVILSPLNVLPRRLSLVTDLIDFYLESVQFVEKHFEEYA